MSQNLEQLPDVYEHQQTGSARNQPVFQPLEPESGTVPLSHYFWVLQKQVWKIAIFVMTSMVLTFITSSKLQPIYEGTATINIDRTAPVGVVGEGAKDSTGVGQDADQYLATQLSIIQSDAVLRPVARRFDLLNRENQMRGLSAHARDIKESAPTHLERLKVIRPPNTYLIRISYRSPDRTIATDVANAIARSYLEHVYRIQIDSATSAATFMERQLDELKAKMERSGHALGQFEREMNIVNPEEKTNITSARLLQLNTEYTTAQSDRVKKEAIYNSMKTGSLAAVQISGQGADLDKLQDRVAEAKAQFALVKASRGSNHPDYKKALLELNEVLAQYQQTRQEIASRIEADYRQSLNREEMLQQAVAVTKTEFDKLNEHSFDYQQLKQEADADKKLYEELVTKIREEGINAGFENRNIAVSDQARPASSAVFPNTKLNLLVAFSLSLFLGIAGATLLDTLDTTVRDPEQVSRLFNIELIGSLPLVRDAKALWAVQPAIGDGAKRLPASMDIEKHGGQSLSAYEEAVRMLRNSILLGDFDRHLRSILFTSATPGEGKTTTALHLALAHASQGKRTLLIDADLRRPTLHRKFGLSIDSGLSTVLTGDCAWRDTLVQIFQNPNLDFLPAGPPSRRAADLVGSGVGDILEEASRIYDLVVVDAPPMLGFAEPMQLAITVDGVIVVSTAGETHRKAIASVVQTLKQLRANTLGIVLNRLSKGTTSGYYYYQYGYNYAKYGTTEPNQDS